MPGYRSAYAYGYVGMFNSVTIQVMIVMKINCINQIRNRLKIVTGLLTALILVGILICFDIPQIESNRAAASTVATAFSKSTTLQYNYLPVMLRSNIRSNPFGVESNSSFYPNNFITNYTTGMHANYVRLNGRVSWYDLQPEEGNPINWDLLAGFESELRTLREADITPIIVVDDYPRWATIYPTSCGPLLPERYDDFAVFMQALVRRYSTPEFNVHIWEMGNEPDVDYRLLPADSFFGCWGDWDDPFYNGRAYGEMLKVVTPVIRAADPQAQVWIGGLLLANPNTVDDHVGQPEDFLRGILEANAAPYFDVVPYHAYVHYNTERLDGDLFYTDGKGIEIWRDWGGIIRGKGRFLRSIMAEYNVEKPLFITETSMLCAYCSDLPDFYDMQANLAPRSFPRAIADGISGFIWYTLEGPGWFYSGLLDDNQVPKPAYYTYKTLAHMLDRTLFIQPASYGDGIEAYTFHKDAARIDVIFAIDDVTYTIHVPRAQFIGAYDRFGTLITPTLTGSDYTIKIQYEPIYLIRTR